MFLYRTLREVWAEPAGRVLILGVLAIVATGTTFYTLIEKWSIVDALYFTVITLTTIGYGDLHPTTDVSKIFTIFFVLAGVSFILGFLNFIIGRTVKDRVEKKQKGK
ncbi:MAG TPA: potassium channel family protein [Acidimicrobiia bacterium]|nr:potassium channel family protein [Acidimicrobiia bacterium]